MNAKVGPPFKPRSEHARRVSITLAPAEYELLCRLGDGKPVAGIKYLIQQWLESAQES